MTGTFDSITHTFKTHNEDSYGVSNHCYWVIDGALSLNKSKYTDGYSDVVWMVNWWQKYLEYSLCDFDASIAQILEKGVENLNKDFSRFADVDQLSKLDRASASIGIVRVQEGQVECFVLGDVEVNVRMNDGMIHTLVDERLEKFDSKVMNMIYGNDNREIAFNGYTQEELDVLQEHRMKMNHESGYYVLEHDAPAVHNGIQRTFALDQAKDILIMSDGFSSIYNKYDEMTLEELFANCAESGVAPILDHIRKLEKEDPDLQKYKRLRQHDDVTAIYMSREASEE